VTQAPQGVAFSVNGEPAETLPWLEGRTFRKRDALLSFRAGAGAGPAGELRFDTGGDHFVLRRVSETAQAPAAPLTTFEGTYEGPQPGTTIRIAVVSDTLRLLPSGGGTVNLIPQSGTTFYSGREGSPRTLTFELGADGKVGSITLKGPGGERTLKKLP
jgi:hypothetical protein